MLKYILGFCLLTSVAFGHSWFKEECCSGSDCIPIQCSDIVDDGNKYYYQGIQANQVLPSQDSKCYVCPRYLQGKIDLIRCLYIQQGV